MARPGARSRSRSNPPQDSSGTLAAFIGHELNNIAVPLEGFAELALQTLAPGEAARDSLEEMRIAIGRITALAAELASLGEAQSTPARAAIGDCMPEEPAGSANIEYLCSRKTLVTVDRLHAQRAIESLARIATPADAQSSAPQLTTPQLTVSQAPRPAAHCAACGAVLALRRRRVWVEAYSPRALGSEVMKDPLGSPRRAGRRLTLAVLVHCAHRAGGHLLLDERKGRLSLAFSAS